MLARMLVDFSWCLLIYYKMKIMNIPFMRFVWRYVCVAVLASIMLIVFLAPENYAGASEATKIEVVGYSEYTKWAQDRIGALRETIAMAKKAQGKEEAYALFTYMEKGSQQSPDFYVNREELSEEELMEVDALEKEMKSFNLLAFIALKKACERIVEAKGYGNHFLHEYYEEKLNELSKAFPL